MKSKNGREKIKKMVSVLLFKVLKIKSRKEKKVLICNVEESLEKLNENSKSLARFGDGELDVILGGHIGFQSKNTALADRLLEVLTHPIENCFFAVPDAINMENYDNLTDESFFFWTQNMCKNRKKWMNILNNKEEYLSTNVTRLYIRYQNKEKCAENFEKLMQLWKDKDILVVEGDKTALGVGNKFLEGARSIKRIICPAKNAFDKYDEIIRTIKKYAEDRLILLALGPTATILAYDLAKAGYRALDVGHCDIEYEWFLAGVNKKVAIANKYTNEVKDGDNVLPIHNLEYKKQIIEKISE